MNRLKILALSGSLREASYNTAVLKALQHSVPSHVEIAIGSIAELPLFNPDLEHEDIIPLKKLKESLSESSGLIIATPEYAHGISGPLKNALDWLVGGVEFPYKPVMLINTSPRATHAQEHLKEVLNTMSAHVVDSAYVSIPLFGSGLGWEAIAQDKAMVSILKTGLDAFCCEI